MGILFDEKMGCEKLNPSADTYYLFIYSFTFLGDLLRYSKSWSAICNFLYTTKSLLTINLCLIKGLRSEMVMWNSGPSPGFLIQAWKPRFCVLEIFSLVPFDRSALSSAANFISNFLSLMGPTGKIRFILFSMWDPHDLHVIIVKLTWDPHWN